MTDPIIATVDDCAALALQINAHLRECVRQSYEADDMQALAMLLALQRELNCFQSLLEDVRVERDFSVASLNGVH